RRKPLLFRMFTGLSAAAFDALVADLEPVWLARKATRGARRPRQRKPGAGRKVKLAFADRVLVVLLYYRVYVTQEFVGFLFGVDKG
ncbi:transposase family protein, partial [Gemmata sp. JC717]|uniref:transposase family protein n=1 Tax=Gemmata algarum TaxID=2975278 RepID=UPI0021BA4612